MLTQSTVDRLHQMRLWGMSEAFVAEFLEVIDDRAQTRSTIVASQLPVEHWLGLLPDPTVADAILDRLVHNAHKIALRGESMRKVTSRLQQIDQSAE